MNENTIHIIESIYTSFYQNETEVTINKKLIAVLGIALPIIVVVVSMLTMVF